MAKCSFSECDRDAYAKGFCRTHYSQKNRGVPITKIRNQRGGCVSPHTLFDIDEKGCHVFRGFKTKKGYGHAKVDGKMKLVHRVAWESEVGPIPESMVVDHICRNRACCNIDHLRVVTQQVNATENVVGAGWQIEKEKTHCPQGHEYTEENTYAYRGWRYCRTCQRERNSRRRYSQHSKPQRG